VFSGGSYDEVARWLRIFLASHAKREDPRIEAVVETDGARAERSYGTRLRLGARVTALVELDYRDIADHRGSLAWCAALAERTRVAARGLHVGAS